jgi:N6-adenosine-specific RNA methylase IME4
MGMQPPQMQTYPRGRHSAKPGEFRAMIEQLYPTAPKIELFARGASAPGWDAWGKDCAIAPEPEASALTSCSPGTRSASGFYAIWRC